MEGTLENPVWSGAEGARSAEQTESLRQKDRADTDNFSCLHFLFSGVADFSAASFFFILTGAECPTIKKRKREEKKNAGIFR